MVNRADQRITLWTPKHSTDQGRFCVAAYNYVLFFLCNLTISVDLSTNRKNKLTSSFGGAVCGVFVASPAEHNLKKKKER